MQTVDISFTSGYSIGLATALNPSNPSRPMRAAAELWHLLCWKYNDLRTDQRVVARDGFFYVTAEWYEHFTGYNKNTFTEACKILQRAGLVECKRMYALGTSVSYNHFKLLYSAWELAPDNDFFVKPNSQPGVIGQVTVGGNCYHKEEKEEENSKVSLGRETSPSGPFGLGTKEINIRPGGGSAETRANRRAYAISKNIRQRLGLRGKPSSIYKQAVQRWLDAGFSEDDIMEANQLMLAANDGFHENLTPEARLKSTNMDWYQEQKKRGAKTLPKGVW